MSKCFINRRTTRLIYPAFERVFIVSDSAKVIFDNIFPELSDKTRVFHNIVNADEVRRLSREYGIKKRPADMYRRPRSMGKSTRHRSAGSKKT